MEILFKSRIFKFFVTSVLLISLILVVVFGQIKVRQNSAKLQAELANMEADRKSATDNTYEQKKEAAEGVSLPSSAEKTYTYKGAGSIGQLNITRWKDKKWLALGDNITAKNSYQSRVKLSCSMANVTTDADAGRLMGDAANNINSDKLKDIDIVTVFAGTSDYSLNTPLGTIGDNENSNTFYGSVHKTIKKILDSKEDVTIVFFTPLKRGAYKNYPVYPGANSAGVKLEDYVQAIKDVCKSYNILVLDLFNNSGINENNIKNYTIDNLHLNEAGSQRIIKQISDYFKTIK
ncbi:SGNH/GDSL hydrolase family protein [Clostridium sp. SYSU_GA19001]|uniref:SGNH/GDSL hydrolase family protein n=1 Tax=Clostridium caldaquaticum TaxID=2940653 RepID=UPI002076F91F|nr:SGNH/GDSL hydrolase family protein [Clostridium caldaquaticum]MCM8711386.1 SGNH/GDSL hydrolase family protein [Clostridium caldaquaticum]